MLVSPDLLHSLPEERTIEYASPSVAYAGEQLDEKVGRSLEGPSQLCRLPYFFAGSRIGDRIRQTYVGMDRSLIFEDNASTLDCNDIERLFDELDADRDGFVTRQDLEDKINDVLAATRSTPRELEKSVAVDNHNDYRSTTDTLLRDLLPPHKDTLNRSEFYECAKWWPVQSPSINETRYQRSKHPRLPLFRWIRSYYAVHGPNIFFIALVVAAQIGCGLWQMVSLFPTLVQIPTDAKFVTLDDLR